MYMIIARIKGLYRFAAFHLGSPTYSAYSDAARQSSGYDGSYAIRDWCIAFRRNDGRIQFVW